MQELIELSKIFSDQNRLNIIALILREKEVCVCEICNTLKLSQPLVSRHLKQMKAAKVLQASKEGKWVHYTLSTTLHPLLKTVLSELSQLTNKLPKIVACTR